MYSQNKIIRIIIIRFTVIFLVAVLLLPAKAFSQKKESINEIKQMSIALFREGKYAEALPLMEKLVESYPKEAIYQYYAGVCLVETGRDLVRAMDYLKFSTTGHVPAEAYYYLGKVYHHQYYFEDALKALYHYKKNARSSDIKKRPVEYLINCSRNGIELLRTIRILNVMGKETVPESEILTIMNQRIAGRMVPKPEQLWSKKDKKAGTEGQLYIPTYTDSLQYLFFASLSRGKPDHYDLYRVQLFENGQYSDPENLGEVINTSHNEISPYYDYDQKVLYFASQGHNSMGGYDLFQSSYNQETNSWSVPVNLDFPISSTADDSHFYPSSRHDRAFFISNRNVGTDTISIIEVEFPLKQVNRTLDNHDDLQQTALLVSDLKNFPETEIKEAESKPKKMEKKTVMDDRPAEPVKLKPVMDDPRYLKLVNERDVMQFKVDSVQNMISIKGKSLDTIHQASEKAIVEMEIERLNKRAALLRDIANSKEKEVKEMEKKYQLNELREMVAIEDKTIDGATYYRFTDKKDIQDPCEVDSISESSASEDLRIEQIKQTPAILEQVKNENNKQAVEKTVPQAPEVQKEFSIKPVDDSRAAFEGIQIFSSSQYSRKNPVPVNVPLPGGVIYRIQIGVYSKILEPDAFGGIYPQSIEVLKDRGLYKYYAGFFRSYDEAETGLKKLKGKGYKDAFIVATKDGKIVPPEEARQME